MLFGPARFLACPTCGAFASVSTLMSGNTFGAVHFTDGSMLATGLPDEPRITRCKDCGTLYWIDDETTVQDPWSGVPVDPDLRERAERNEPPSTDDFAEALASGLASDPAQEFYLRVRLWWAGNEGFRSAPRDSLPDWPEGMVENLKRLDQLLDESEPGERLMKAEIARETGRFDAAAELLAREFPEDFAHTADEIRRLTAERVAVVRMIPNPSRREQGEQGFSPRSSAHSRNRAAPPPHPGYGPAPILDVPLPGSGEAQPDTEYFPEGAATPTASQEPNAAIIRHSFANFQVRSDRSEEVERALDGIIGGRAYISSSEGGWVQVCDEASESAEIAELFRVARELSARLHTGVFAFRLKEDNIMWYWLYESGILIDQFDSWPNAFGMVDSATRSRIQGQPEVLSRYCVPGTPAEEIEFVLKPTRLFEVGVPFMEEMPYLMQEHRLGHMARLLGFSDARCCLGFQDVAQGAFFFATEDVFTEGAMDERRAASGGFRLIGAGLDR